MKTILVTGALGYLGSVLTHYLTNNNFSVVGYDTGFFKNALICPEYSSNTIIKDARSIDDNDIRGIYAVVHLAGISNDPIGKLDPALVYDPTRAYTDKIARLCKKHGVKFIFASSCSVYGIGDDDFLTETSKTNPQTSYSLNKVQIESDLQSLSDKKFSPIALRFATAFGPSPRIRFDIVINMLAGMAVSSKSIILNSNGMSWRPNVHILDICKSIKCAIDIDYKEDNLLIVNIGSDNNNLRVIDIAKIVQKIVPQCDLKFLEENPNLDTHGLVRDRKIKNGDDTRTYKVSFEKVMKVFPDFNCEWGIESGVENLTKFLLNLKLNQSTFNSHNYYRLQKLEELFSEGLISEDLKWK